MFYVFLDIDGVLNVKGNEVAGVKDVSMFCVRRFVEALEDFHDIRIVLTSEWRKWFHLPDYCDSYLSYLQRYLRKYGLEVWDKTPEIAYATREAEIKSYIQKNKITKYVIIDDEQQHYSYGNKELYLVDPKKGFSGDDVERLEAKCLKLWGNWYDEEELECDEFDDYDDFDESFFVERPREYKTISFLLKPKERYQDTGKALIRLFNGERIMHLPGVVSSGPEFEIFTLVGIHICMNKTEILDFLQGLHDAINDMFPLGNVLELFTFEANQFNESQILKKAIEEFSSRNLLAERGADKVE